MSDYITEDELREYIGSDTTNFATTAASVCTVASRAVEQFCGRYFYADSVVSARYFPVWNNWSACTDDISTTTGLIVATDDGYDGTYGTTWTITTDFVLQPANPARSGTTVPYRELAATGTKVFPPSYRGRPNPLKVTATWGWAAVPADVKHATLLHAAWLFKMKDSPDGFVGMSGWGEVRVRENAAVASLLTPYALDTVAIA